MLKFAILQLSDKQLAEDAVQEALLGALKNVSAFGRKSALKTWVFSILKNKIIDILRKKARHKETSLSTTLNTDEDEDLEMLFNDRGYWQKDERPIGWSYPADSVEQDHFWRVFEVCLDGLPPNQGRIFMMREFLELDTKEICESAEISTSNLHVVLYRARLRLRECLENRWFLEGEHP
jgi:RNA polymerase sigma-70 factor (ECF subfamily)